MIDLTPAAATRLRELRGDDPRNRFVRVFVAGVGCCGHQFGLAFDDEITPEDTLIERDGIAIAVAPASQTAAQGATIDFVDTSTGAGFMVREAGGGGGCACGRR